MNATQSPRCVGTRCARKRSPRHERWETVINLSSLIALRSRDISFFFFSAFSEGYGLVRTWSKVLFEVSLKKLSFLTSSPHHTFRMKQARQCLERPFTGQLGYAFTYSFGFVLTKPFSKEKSLKKLFTILCCFFPFCLFMQPSEDQLC